MCGIAGVFEYRSEGKTVQQTELERMCAAMALRGPDAQGVWLNPERSVGFGHRRLSILDLSAAGSQPMLSADGDDVIVLNGEIYNHLELRRELIARGEQFRSTSDTETLLAMYRHYGEFMVPRLRGMFAFAIWRQSTRTLFIARDPLGIKPLYIADDGRTLRFASQVKALLAGGGVSTTEDPAGRVGFMIWGSVPEPFTFYREIRALVPGIGLMVRPGDSPTRRRYTSLKELLREREAEPALESAENAAQRAREAIRDSIRAHLLSDVPVGVFLSAGIDSAAVLGVAAEFSEVQLEALTLEFPEFLGKNSNESPGAARIASYYGVPHVVGRIDGEDFAREMDNLLLAMDQPSIDGVNTYFVSRQARRQGWKVALSGVGSDEFSGGYSHFQDIPSLVRTLRFLRHAGGVGRLVRRLSAPFVKRLNSPKYASLIEYGSSIAGAYLLRRALFLPWELPSLMDPELAAEGLEALDVHGSLEHTVSGIRGTFPSLVLLEMNWYLRNQLLRDADWAGMAHSLEIRTPLVDYQLLEALAPLIVSPHRPRKLDVANAPSKPLPDDVINRPKTGFGVPVQEWIARHRHLPFRDNGLRSYARFLLAH